MKKIKFFSRIDISYLEEDVNCFCSNRSVIDIKFQIATIGVGERRVYAMIIYEE